MKRTATTFLDRFHIAADPLTFLVLRVSHHSCRSPSAYLPRIKSSADLFPEKTCWEGEGKTSFSMNRNEGCFADESARGYYWIHRPRGPTEPLCLVTYADKRCNNKCPVAMLQLDRNDGGWCHKFSDPNYGYKWFHNDGVSCFLTAVETGCLNQELNWSIASQRSDKFADSPGALPPS